MNAKLFIKLTNKIFYKIWKPNWNVSIELDFISIFLEWNLFFISFYDSDAKLIRIIIYDYGTILNYNINYLSIYIHNSNRIIINLIFILYKP